MADTESTYEDIRKAEQERDELQEMFVKGGMALQQSTSLLKNTSAALTDSMARFRLVQEGIAGDLRSLTEMFVEEQEQYREAVEESISTALFKSNVDEYILKHGFKLKVRALVKAMYHDPAHRDVYVEELKKCPSCWLRDIALYQETEEQHYLESARKDNPEKVYAYIVYICALLKDRYHAGAYYRKYLDLDLETGVGVEYRDFLCFQQSGLIPWHKDIQKALQANVDCIRPYIQSEVKQYFLSRKLPVTEEFPLLKKYSRDYDSLMEILQDARKENLLAPQEEAAPETFRPQFDAFIDAEDADESENLNVIFPGRRVKEDVPLAEFWRKAVFEESGALSRLARKLFEEEIAEGFRELMRANRVRIPDHVYCDFDGVQLRVRADEETVLAGGKFGWFRMVCAGLLIMAVLYAVLIGPWGWLVVLAAVAVCGGQLYLDTFRQPSDAGARLFAQRSEAYVFGSWRTMGLYVLFAGCLAGLLSVPEYRAVLVFGLAIAIGGLVSQAVSGVRRTRSEMDTLNAQIAGVQAELKTWNQMYEAYEKQSRALKKAFVQGEQE
ncbi:MAG: hypothetical protein IKD69_14875 [Solobacterium sp.]|nr:hypothetical protein [Solobacterium sp.]